MFSRFKSKNALEWVLIVFILLGVAFSAIGGITTWDAHFRDDFRGYKEASGKITFETEEEYADFTSILARDEVYYFTIDVINPQPPIVAAYTIQYDNNFGFPYPETKKHAPALPFESPWMLPAGIVLLSGATTIWYKNRILWQKKKES